MSQQTKEIRYFTAGEALAAYRCVKLSSGTIVYADAADDQAWIGITQEACANGANVAVKLKTTASTFKVTAGEAFALGASLYSDADGKLADTDPTDGVILAVALEAATAEDDIVEVLPTTETYVPTS